MAPRSQTRRALSLGCALALLGTACSRGEPPRAENVVLVSVDTLRADVLGPYGGALPTPASDRLAAEGVVVEGACTPTPSTGPAHASLLTGLHPWNHGVLLNATPLAEDGLPNLAVEVRRAGIETGAFVSSFMVAERWGFAQGFAEFHFKPSQAWRWKGEPIGFYNIGAETTDSALAWIEEHREERFFVWIHYFDPHSPYGAPEGYRRPPNEEIDMRGKSLPPKVKSRAHLAGLIRAYRGEVAYTDAQLGRLLDGLDRLGLAETTAFVVTSDHGEGLGDHGWLGHGRNLHDELVLVPLLLRGPGLPAGLRLEGPAQLEDLMPTLLAWLGLAAPEGLDGVNLLPWLRGAADVSPRAAVVGRRAAYPDVPPLFFQRRFPEKWIGEREGTGDGYRLDRDPGEKLAIGAAPPEILSQRLSAGRDAQGERVLDDEARQALEALGYLDPAGGGTTPQ